MKVLNLIIAIYFIYYVYCEAEDCGTYSSQPKSADDCKNKKVSETGSKCCYEYYSKLEDKGGCTVLDKYELENIGKLIKIYELRREIYEDDPEKKKYYDEYGDYHIDCFSAYIKISLISILLLLF